MEIIRSLVQNLIFIIIMAVFLELLLPMGEMKKYVKMVMGLLIIVAVIQAVVELTRWNISGDLPLFTQYEDKKHLSVIEEGKKISSIQMDKAVEKYRKAISNQIVGLVRLNKEVDIVGVDVKVQSDIGEDGFGQLKEIILTVARTAELEGKKTRNDNEEVGSVYVRVDRQSYGNEAAGQGSPRDSVEQVISTIVNFYNLRTEQVKVVYR